MLLLLTKVAGGTPSFQHSGGEGTINTEGVGP